MPAIKNKTQPFFYVLGDKNKTPVKLSEQKPGTTLVMVNPIGQESTFTVGTRIVNANSTPSWLESMRTGAPEQLD